MLTTFCSFFLVIENYYSLADIFWRTEVIDKLYYVRSADENVGGPVVDIFWKTEVIGKLYCVRSVDVGGSVVDVFRKTEVIGKLYYVRSTDENVGGSVVDALWKNGRNWQAVPRAVRLRNEGGTVGVFCFLF